MGGLSSPLEFQQISEVLRNTRGRIATVATIANRLERGVSLVQRALDGMLAGGALEIVQTFRGPQYRLMDGSVALEGTVLPYESSRDRLTDADDGSEDDGELEPEGEAIRAAGLWRTRMGGQRWRDDPRALAERMQQQHCIPPFYNTAAREF